MSDPRPSARQLRASTVVLVATTVMAFGLGMLVTFRPLPTAAPAAGSGTASVESIEYSDTHLVAVSIGLDDGVALRTRAGGTVTALDCAPGGSWESGTAPIAVDLRPRLALSTTTPLFRDLSPGDSGADVEGLHAALRSLGADAPEGNRFTTATTGALAEVAEKAGVSLSGEGLLLDEVVWLPASPVAIGSCEATIGASIAGDEQIATTAPRITYLSIPLPEQQLPGARTARIDAVSIPLPNDGASPAVIEDPKVIETVSALPQVSAVLAGSVEPAGALEARVELAAPVNAHIVPASSIIPHSSSEGCVDSGTGLVHARILGASLGRTYVQFEREAPSTVQLSPDHSLTCP